MIVPFGLAIPMGFVVGRLLMILAVTVQKCAVLPLSAMARESGGISSWGGPTKTVERHKADSSLETLGRMVVAVTVTGVVGSPRRQFGDGAGRRRGRPDEMVLLPPFILNAVASSLCPSALR